MPVFSFTAPHITPEQEEKELASLSVSKRQELQNDLYGIGPACPQETPEMMEEALDAFNNEMDSMPTSQKGGYLEAQHRAPKLLVAEVGPEKFVRCEGYDGKAAAQRMAAYWKARRKLYGEQLAFLPMTLEGAMQQDVATVESGIIAIHPKDEQGRGVLFSDRIRAIPPLFPRESALRCLFYMIHVMSEDVDIQRLGYVSLANLKGYDLYKHFDRLLTKQASILFVQCMPIKMKALHFLAGSAKGVMSLVLPVLKHVMATDCRLRMVVHSGPDDKTMESLHPYGIRSQNVSHIASGCFNHSDFEQWLEGWRAQEKAQHDST